MSALISITARMLDWRSLNVQERSVVRRCLQWGSTLIAGPQEMLKGKWWDQANPQPEFVNAFGVLFDTNRGHFHDLSKRKPSLLLRLPER